MVDMVPTYADLNACLVYKLFFSFLKVDYVKRKLYLEKSWVKKEVLWKNTVLNCPPTWALKSDFFPPCRIVLILSHTVLNFASPRGQGHPAGNSPPYFGPSLKLDFELEMVSLLSRCTSSIFETPPPQKKNEDETMIWKYIIQVVLAPLRL